MAGKREENEALDRALFVAILQAAYSGELAAAYAYRGHWRSLWRSRRAETKAGIRAIEAEEWHHRRQVGAILAELGEGPQRWREVLMGTIGRFFGTLCFVGGWFGPLYAAGRLEAANVGQYEQAARHAARCGLDRYLPQLAEMVAVEDRHERFFGDLVRDHPLLPLVAVVGGWRPPSVAPAVAD
ncbi:MAG: ferritin-like protein [Acidimicrobiales bacterium]|nr:ferritin-like protein [Acidimicrobiales bacterium]